VAGKRTIAGEAAAQSMNWLTETLRNVILRPLVWLAITVMRWFRGRDDEF